MRDSIFKRLLNRDELANQPTIANCAVSVSSNINVPIQITDTTPLPSNEDMGGQESPTGSWWQQIQSYGAVFMERVKDGVESVKEFLSTLTSDERWGVMLAFEEAEPVVFGRLVAAAPEWVEWMG